MSDAPLYLAIDQGGHASRAVVFDKRGAIVANAAVPVETLRPGPGRVEHDAETLVATVVEAVEEALGTLGSRAGDLRAAGLATQRSSVVCWDRRSGQALSPVLSWQDVRGADWLGQFEAEARRVQTRSGLVLSPHYGASKLRWCLDNIPEVRDAETHGNLAFGPLASFLVYRLTRERSHVVDPANAARTLLYDLGSRDWSPELLDLFGIPRTALPRCVPSRHEFGTLCVCDREVALTVTTGDQSAALFAHGVPDPEACYVNIGTGAFAQRAAGPKPIATPALLAGIVWQDTDGAVYVLEGTVNGAGNALEQVGSGFGLSAGEVWQQVKRGLTDVMDVPLFLNGVGGLGSPWWESDFESRFVPEAGEADAQLAAVVESIVFGLQVNFEHMQEHLAPPQRVVITGGLAALDGLCLRLANLCGLRVERPAALEATARGLSYLLAGCSSDVPGPAEIFEPSTDTALEERYRRWRAQMPPADAIRL